MSRRLTEDERIERRKERASFSFSNAAYQHYDVKRDGYGKPEDWERIAEQLFGTVERTPRADTRFVKLLALLGLSNLPSVLSDLTRAFRAAMFKAHPDYGGSDDAARQVLEAYAVLKKELK